MRTRPDARSDARFCTTFVLAAALVTALSPASAARAEEAAETDPAADVDVPLVPRPGYRIPTEDPTFHNLMERITDDSGRPISGVDGTWGADARHVYSKQSAWSVDGGLLCVQNRGGGTPSVLFLDGTSYQPVFAGCSSLYDYRWNPDALRGSEMINVDKTGRELSLINVRTCKKRRTWALPITAAYGIGSGEGNVSFDARYVVVANPTELVVVDMNPAPPLAPYPSRRFGPVYTIPPCGFPDGDCRIGNVSISPSGRYIDVKYSGPSDTTQDLHRIFEVDASTLEVRPHEMATDALRCGSYAARTDGWVFPLKHADMAYDPFDYNEDILVGGRSCPGSKIGRIVKVRLRDGKVTPLTSPSNEASMQHVSTRNTYRSGWAYVGYYRQDGRRYSDQIVAVKLDGSLSTQSIAHKHSQSDGCYRCESHPVPSPDGRRVLFASNWMQDCSGDCGSSDEIKDYVVEVPIARRVAPAIPPEGIPEDADTEEPTDPVASDGPPQPEEIVGGRDETAESLDDSDFDTSLGLAFESVRPNPAVTGADVVYTSSGGRSVDLELIDAGGRRVQRRSLGIPPPGRQHVRLDRARGLAPGVYWLRLSTTESARTARILFVG